MMKTQSSQLKPLTLNLVAGGRPVSVGASEFRLRALLALSTFLFAGVPTLDQTPSLAGSWSGEVGCLLPPALKRRLGAGYNRVRADSYELSATCATASGSASQTAAVYEVSPNRFRGSFHNLNTTCQDVSAS